MWIVLLGLPVVANDWHKIQQYGIFQGYSVIVWTVAIFQALTSVLVGLVIKYTDSILKVFATLVAFVLDAIMSFFVFNAQVVFSFFVGAYLVVCLLFRRKLSILLALQPPIMNQYALGEF